MRMGEYEARESEGELGLLHSRQRRRSCVQVGGELAEKLEDAWEGGDNTGFRQSDGC